MVNITFAPRVTGKTARVTVYFDKILETDGDIIIDQDEYTSGLERVYEVKGRKNMHAEIENTGVTNGLTYRIEAASKEFRVLTDLIDADFTDLIKIDTNVAANLLANGTVTCASVTGEVHANGTITVASAVANTFATGTATLVSVIATDTVTFNGLIYLAVSGAASEGEFDIDGDDNANAIELRNAINTDTRSGTTGDLTASASTNVVTATTDVAGAAGNAITLTSQDATITVSGSGTFTGGVTADTVTPNGLGYKAVVGVKSNNTEFSIDGDDTATALDLADSITNDTRTGTLNDLTATSSSAVVTCVQTVGGTGGNATTLVSSDGTRLAVSGATFANGINGDTVTPNGLVYTATVGPKADNTQFSVDTGDDECATDLAASITNDTRTGTLDDVIATSASAVVTMTQTVAGVGGNATTLVSSDGTRLAVSGATFANGADGVIVKDGIVDISPESTAIRVRVKRQTSGLNTTRTGIVSVN